MIWLTERMRAYGIRVDQLFVVELFEAGLRQFAPEAGVLHAAERQFRRHAKRPVDEHHAAVDLTGDLAPTLGIRGEDGSAETMEDKLADLNFFRRTPPSSSV